MKRTIHGRTPWRGWAAAAWLGCAAAARGQEWEFDPEAAVRWLAGNPEIAQQVLDLAGDWQTQIVATVRAQIPQLLVEAEQSLRDASPEDMAELQPVLRQVAAHAKQLPELAPYADWLESRLDYFDAARRAVVLAPSPRPARPPVAPAGPPGTRPRRTPRPAPPPEVARARTKTLTNSAQWRRQLEKRPAPARAAALAPRLRSAFRREGVPAALIWMAEVESSMNPSARSPVGAAGLFQLMPATARTLGLRTTPTDERLDPDKSAAAAARHLRRLHGRFGSWPLALASYNAGEARVASLLKTRKAADFEGIAEALPAETQMYVPRVLETVRLREGVDPARLPPPG